MWVRIPSLIGRPMRRALDSITSNTSWYEYCPIEVSKAQIQFSARLYPLPSLSPLSTSHVSTSRSHLSPPHSMAAPADWFALSKKQGTEGIRRFTHYCWDRDCYIDKFGVYSQMEVELPQLLHGRSRKNTLQLIATSLAHANSGGLFVPNSAMKRCRRNTVRSRVTPMVAAILAEGSKLSVRQITDKLNLEPGVSVKKSLVGAIKMELSKASTPPAANPIVMSDSDCSDISMIKSPSPPPEVVPPLPDLGPEGSNPAVGSSPAAGSSPTVPSAGYSSNSSGPTPKTVRKQRLECGCFGICWCNWKVPLRTGTAKLAAFHQATKDKIAARKAKELAWQNRNHNNNRSLLEPYSGPTDTTTSVRPKGRKPIVAPPAGRTKRGKFAKGHVP